MPEITNKTRTSSLLLVAATHIYIRLPSPTICRVIVRRLIDLSIWWILNYGGTFRRRPMNGTQINRCIHLGTDKVDGVIGGFNHFLFYLSPAAVEKNKLFIHCRMKTNGWAFDDGLGNWHLRNQYPRIAEEE